MPADAIAKTDAITTFFIPKLLGLKAGCMALNSNHFRSASRDIFHAMLSNPKSVAMLRIIETMEYKTQDSAAFSTA
jgi:hypothetical protein